MSEQTIGPNLVEQFCRALEGLDAADRARLRRAAGHSLAEAGDALAVFYRILPHGVPQRQEETYFMVASLYPLGTDGNHGDFGALLKRARIAGGEKGTDSRMRYLLDADEAQLAFRLRQAVHYVKSCGVAVDWPTLLQDLLYWDHPDRFVQKKWVRSYYGQTRTQTQEA